MPPRARPRAPAIYAGRISPVPPNDSGESQQSSTLPGSASWARRPTAAFSTSGRNSANRNGGWAGRACSSFPRPRRRTLRFRGWNACAGSESSTAPTVLNRRAPIAAERLRSQFHARRRLPALVLRPVDHGDCALDDVAIEAVPGQLLQRPVVLDVLLEHLVELRIRRQGVLVELVVAQLGARRAVDDALRNQLMTGSLVEVARKLEHVRLVDVLQEGEATGHVAVEGCVPDRELRLVTGRDEHPAELVRQRHQQDAAGARLDVLLGQISLRARERLPQRVVERVDDRADRNLQERTAEALGQASRVAARPFRRIARGHRDAVHVLGPERFGGERRGHRGIDSPRDADDDFLEAVLADVVAQAELERSTHLLDLVDEGDDLAAGLGPVARRSRR